MSTTFGALKTGVSEALRDPSGKTFVDAALGRLVNEALADVGQIIPVMFQEDITPVADTIDYIVRSTAFGGEANSDIEVARVELWDGSVTPPTRTAVVVPASAGYADDSESGWSNWGGTLHFPSWVFSVVDGHEDQYIYRLWGYSPYPDLSGDSDVCPLSTKGYWAVIARARVAGLEQLKADRDLFTQWQTRSGNTDVSPAGLLGELNAARDDWRHKSRGLLRLRASV